MNAKYGNVTTKILTVLLVLAMVMVARESAQFVSTLEENARRTLHKNGEETMRSKRISIWQLP